MSKVSPITATELERTAVVAIEPSFEAARARKRELLREQQACWKRGSPVPLEDLLRRWPGDPASDPDVANLLVEDLLQRQRRGEPVGLEDYAARFPAHRDNLARLLVQHQELSSAGVCDAATELSLPVVGDTLFGFRLRYELGRGAFARVFLAEQAELAGRPVVLKISAIEGSEPQTLAQLQHTHIVPIYSAHEDPRTGLRGLCMPYFGGASLAQVLTQLWDTGTPVRLGEQLTAALQAVQAPPPDEARPAGAGPRDEGRGTKEESRPSSLAPAPTPLAVLAERSYFHAAAWVMARLAEGLEHAHQRGVLHRDVKPSNILIAADGQPLLLDFNLAHDDGRPARATLGGTVAYMAPEHICALAARSAELARAVDRRSDVYSLGLVLYEMLTGESPFEHRASYSAAPVILEVMAEERSKHPPSVRARRPDVPWSMESIVRKCLAPEPDARYQRAEDLGEDLRRFLTDRPLKFAPELSRSERLRKWSRRHPRLTAGAWVAAAAGLLLAVTGVALGGLSERLESTREALEHAEAQQRQRAYEEGTMRALCLVNAAFDSQDNLRQGVRACEETLALHGVLEGASWREPADWARLDPAVRRRLAEDTRELLLLLAGARVRLAPEDQDKLRQALQLLDRAEAISGLPSAKALYLDRANYLALLGQSEAARAAEQRADQIPAASARDLYLLAAAYARKGGSDGYQRALVELNRALQLNPRYYWAWIRRGLCHQELKEYVLAAGDFGTCIGLWPEFSWGYFSRAWLLDQTGNKAAAIADYTAALKCDPRLAPAYVNRGLANLELKRYAEALADFDHALVLGKDDAPVYASRGIALEASGRHGEADVAFRTAFARVEGQPASVRLRIRWTYGFAISARLPEKARAAFDEVLRHNAGHPQALYGRGLLAAEGGRTAEALRFFHRAVEADANFVVARRYRALMRARLGEFKPALEDINWCLEREPKVGLTLYTAGCIAARAAEKFGDPQASAQAIEFLEKALAHGVDRAKLADDEDLAGIRTHPEFQRLLGRQPRSREAAAAKSI